MAMSNAVNNTNMKVGTTASNRRQHYLTSATQVVSASEASVGQMIDTLSKANHSRFLTTNINPDAAR